MPIALPETLPNLDDVDERSKQFYEAGEDGVFKLQDISALKTSMKNAKTERNTLSELSKSAQAEVAKWKALGATPDEIKAVLDKRAQYEEFDSTKGVEIEKIKGDITRQFEGKLMAESGEKTRYQKAAENLARKNALDAELAKSGANALGLKYLRGDLEKEISFEWHGDEPTIKLLDKDGKQRLNPETYDPLTLSDLIAIHRKEAPELFKSDYEGKGGSGVDGGGDKGDTNTKPLDKWDFREIKAYNLRHGDPEAYNKAVKSSQGKGG